MVPSVTKFNPELILVSCGFDASSTDPLAHMMLTGEDFHAMTKQLMAIQSKVVLLHEGGYCPVQVPFCGLSVMRALVGEECFELKYNDPFEEDANQYGYQELQYFQRIIIDNIFQQLQSCSHLLRFPDDGRNAL